MFLDSVQGNGALALSQLVDLALPEVGLDARFAHSCELGLNVDLKLVGQRAAAEIVVVAVTQSLTVEDVRLDVCARVQQLLLRTTLLAAARAGQGLPLQLHLR